MAGMADPWPGARNRTVLVTRQWSPGRLEGIGFEAPIPITLRTGR